MEISEDQLAIDWTLTENDINFVIKNSRGADNRICFAANLCFLRAHSQFITRRDSIPLIAVNYLARQLEYDLMSQVPSCMFHSPEGTQTKIIKYLNYREFDNSEKELLEKWLLNCLREKFYDKKILTQIAKEHLQLREVVLPPPISLGRILAGAIKKAREQLYSHIVFRYPPENLKKLDKLLISKKSGIYAALSTFKQSPPAPSAKVINEYLDYFEHIDKLGILELDLSFISKDVIESFARMGRCYTAYDLRNMNMETKKYAIVICFLYNCGKNILDQLVQMHNDLLSGIHRRARNRIKNRKEKLTKKSKGKLRNAGAFIKQAIQKKETTISLAEFISSFNIESLSISADLCEKLDDIDESGVTENITSSFNYLRRFTKRFFRLDFEAAKGSDAIIRSIEILKRYQEGIIKDIPEDAPTDFLPKMWKDILRDSNGLIIPKYWETGLYYALKKALTSGDVYLSRSLNHQYFWNNVYTEDDWKTDREEKYRELELPFTFDQIEEQLKKQFKEVAELANKALPDNEFAQIVNGELVLHKEDALIIPTAVKILRKKIEAQLPVVRLEELIAKVDKLTKFTKSFAPFYDSAQNSQLSKKSIYAAVMAHATNIGLYGMGHSAIGISTEMIKNASQTYIRSETINAGSNMIIDRHLGYPISKVLGDGSWSSSDGQRFGIQQSSLLSSYYPRFFGYYDKAISIYTHVSDTYDVFATNVISCKEREATYVLTGLLAKNRNEVDRFHCTDTHGYTEHVFALCHLLGFGFHPRLKDLTEQRIYKIKNAGNYGDIESLFAGNIDMQLIRENWDCIVRIVGALKNGHIPAHIIIQKLANRTDSVAKAIQAFGRVVKTIYILRYISDSDLRYKVHLQLNRGESRHSLAKALFFVNRGIFKTNDYEEIMSKATCLSLLSNAILLWNTHHIQNIVNKMRKGGENIPDEYLEKISPLMFKHIRIHGTYHFEDLENVA